jgi:hypothetical protein
VGGLEVFAWVVLFSFALGVFDEKGGLIERFLARHCRKSRMVLDYACVSYVSAYHSSMAARALRTRPGSSDVHLSSAGIASTAGESRPGRDSHSSNEPAEVAC